MGMNNKPIALLPPPPPDVGRTHRNQVRLQIWLPLALAAIVILVLMVLVVLANGTGTPSIHVWGNVAAMYVILPVLMLSLVLMAVLGGLVYLMTRVLKVTPRYLHLAQAYASYVAAMSKLWADRLANPVLMLRGIGAGWWAFKKEVRRGRAASRQQAADRERAEAELRRQTSASSTTH